MRNWTGLCLAAAMLVAAAFLLADGATPGPGGEPPRPSRLGSVKPGRSASTNGKKRASSTTKGLSRKPSNTDVGTRMMPSSYGYGYPAPNPYPAASQPSYQDPHLFQKAADFARRLHGLYDLDGTAMDLLKPTKRTLNFTYDSQRHVLSMNANGKDYDFNSVPLSGQLVSDTKKAVLLTVNDDELTVSHYANDTIDHEWIVRFSGPDAGAALIMTQRSYVRGVLIKSSSPKRYIKRERTGNYTYNSPSNYNASAPYNSAPNYGQQYGNHVGTSPAVGYGGSTNGQWQPNNNQQYPMPQQQQQQQQQSFGGPPAQPQPYWDSATNAWVQPQAQGQYGQTPGQYGQPQAQYGHPPQGQNAHQSSGYWDHNTNQWVNASAPAPQQYPQQQGYGTQAPFDPNYSHTSGYGHGNGGGSQYGGYDPNGGGYNY